MLHTHQNGVNPQWSHISALLLVLDSDLSFMVRLDPVQYFFFIALSQPPAKVVGVQVGQRHRLFSFIRSVTNHESLIASPQILDTLISLQRLVDIRRLHVDRHDNSAILVVHSLLDVIVTDFLDSLSHELLIVDLGFAGDFSENHAHVVFDAGFTGHQRIGVLAQ